MTGSVDVYERDGNYRLYAKDWSRRAVGIYTGWFLKLRDELEEMGMFAPEYKQPIPRYAKTVGVVTAPTGAAIRDIMNITNRRNPVCPPCLISGSGAGEQEPLLPSQPEFVPWTAWAWMLIVGRGGGSIEDLWAFNEEIVARAIFDCATPVISAVGHETDVLTIADYVADLRAPTPSAAAELAMLDYRQL